MTTQSRDLEQLQRTWARPQGLWRWLAPVNNRIIGARYMVTAGAFFLVAGFLALLMRTQLAVPENDFLDPELYNQLFTMHGSTMMFLFIVPFLEGLALYFLPLMIGSRDVAYPRLSAFGYWTYLFGGLIFYASWFVGAVPDAGWYSYTPLSGPIYSPGMGQDFWLLGLSLTELSGVAAGAELVVTTLKLRAPGMSLTRMPIFAWAILVTGFAILFAFTTLFVATLLLELERTFGLIFFYPPEGGSPLLWQHLFWIFGHPEVYIMFIPATGIVSTIVPTFARRPIALYRLIVLALLVTGFVSFGLWAHHMFTAGIPELAASFFTATSFMIALATGTQIFAWIATLWGTRPRVDAPLLYIIGFVVNFMLGGVTGVMVAVVSFDWQVHDTFFVVAHFHYVIIGGVVFPILAALHYWLPKITGRMLSERLGKIAFWVIFVGFNATFFPMHIAGFNGMPRRVYTYQEGAGLTPSNLIATAGAYLLAVGLALFLFNVLWSLRRGAPAGANPWRAGTLEWSIPSPPPNYSLLAPPVVRGHEPLWDEPGRSEPGEERLRAASQALAGAPAAWRATIVTSVLTAEPEGVLYLPGPTVLPLLTALGVSAAAVAMLVKLPWLGLAGAAFALLMLVAWLWPDARERELVRRSDRLLEGISDDPALGNRSVGAWGMAMLVTVLGTVFAVLLFSHLYIWGRSPVWPQEGLPLPSLLLPLGGAVALAMGIVTVSMAGVAARRGERSTLNLGIGATMLLGAGYLALQLYSLLALPFAPTDNAYTSTFYTLNGFMLGLALAGVALLGSALLRSALGLLDPRSSTLRNAALLWYLLAGSGLVTFVVLYLLPRL